MKIEMVDWSYDCGDGCCYEWGVDLFIDGEKINSFSEQALALKWVLINRFGVVIEEGYEDDYDQS